MLYQVYQLRDNSRPGPLGMAGWINEIRPELQSRGINIFGVFGSLLGLASNEMYLVTYADKAEQQALPDGLELLSRTVLQPTIRPVKHAAASEPGVYVFRWFHIEPGNVDEIVQLSGDAWPAFEADFDTKIQGLFVEANENAEQMLLITWYRDLSVWEASRQPSDQTRSNFVRRHKLTRSARPVATTLILNPDNPTLVSHT